MIIEQAGRQLIKIEDEAYWDSLPKELKGIPVYYRFTKTGIDLWPMWNTFYQDDDYKDFQPSIRVSP